VSATFAVDIEFRAKGAQQLQQFNKQAEELKRTVEGTKIDALNGAVAVLPGRLGAAANGILALNRGLRDAQDQAQQTSRQYKQLGVEIAAVQALINQKRIQLGSRGGIGGEALKREIAELQAQKQALSTGASGLASNAGASAMAIGAVGTAAAAAAVAVAAGVAALTTASVTFTNEINRNRQQLTLFTKDAKVTEEIIASLQRTADNTSLGLPGLLEATKTLSAYGVEAKDAGAATKMLGDLALGDNEKLQRFAVNFAQISSLGKAYTVDLKQFGMAGIPIFDALSKATGKSTAEVMKMAEEGKITYPIVVRALQDLTKEGASFYKGAERGGTDLDRSIQQLQGSWEKLQQKISGAVTPAIVSAVKGITEALEGVLAVTDAIGSAMQWLKDGPIGGLVNEITWLLKVTGDFLNSNPAILGTLQMLQAAGRNRQKGKGGDPAADEAERARLAANAQAKARADALAANRKAAEKLAQEVAKVNLDTERSLADARIGYEDQLADFRRQQLQKIADMERDMADERRSEEFKLAQLQASNASKERVGEIDSQIFDARLSGRDTTALEAARAVELDKEKAARKRAEIEFNSTTRKIELERRLTDFKRETERAMGEMQVAYARQTEGILREAGRTVGDLMKQGAIEAAATLEAAGVKLGEQIAQATSGAAAISGSNVGVAQSGGDFSKWDPALLRATGQIDQKYKVPLGTTASLVMFESSGRTDARGPNVPGQGRGHGLFQIMPGTAPELGVNHESVRGMGGVAQMRLLDKYLAGRGFKPGMNPEQMYATVLGGNPWAKGNDLNGTTPGSGAAVQRGYRPAAARAVQGAMAAGAGAAQQAANPVGPGGIFNNSAAPSNLTAAGGIFYNPAAKAPLTALAAGAKVGDQVGPPQGARPTAPATAPAAAPVAAANNIVPTGSIPTTSPALQESNAALDKIRIADQLAQKKAEELELTTSIREAANGIVTDQDSLLKSAKSKNEIDLRTLDLMRSGITPELAAQQAANEKLIEEAVKGLEIQQARAENAVAEKGITEETRAARQKILDDINAQIAGQPELLASLNAEAKLTQQIGNNRKIADKVAQMRQELGDTQGMIVSLAGTVESELGSAMSNAISGVIDGTQTVQQAFGQMFKNIGKAFLDMATQMIAKALIMKVLGLLNPGGSSGPGLGLGDADMFSPMPEFADGGFVTGPTPALVGEGGGSEYIVPEGKMGSAMQRWNSGMRGAAVVDGASPSDTSSDVAVAEAPPSISITGGVLNFNDSQYIKADQAQSLVMQGAKMGEARTLRRLQTSGATRGKLGMR
jgi:tape measure domain-containing protein